MVSRSWFYSNHVFQAFVGTGPCEAASTRSLWLFYSESHLLCQLSTSLLQCCQRLFWVQVCRAQRYPGAQGAHFPKLASTSFSWATAFPHAHPRNLWKGQGAVSALLGCNPDRLQGTACPPRFLLVSSHSHDLNCFSSITHHLILTIYCQWHFLSEAEGPQDGSAH